MKKKITITEIYKKRNYKKGKLKIWKKRITKKGNYIERKFQKNYEEENCKEGKL